MWFFTPKRFLISVIILMIVGLGAGLSLILRPTSPTTAQMFPAPSQTPTPLRKPSENWALSINHVDGFALYYPSEWQIIEKTEKKNASVFIAQALDGSKLRVWTAAFPVSFAVEGIRVGQEEVTVSGVKARQVQFEGVGKRTGILTDFVHKDRAVTVEVTVVGNESPPWSTFATFRDRFHFLE